MKYALRRLLRTLLLIVGVSVFCFLFSALAPGSFFDEIREHPQVSSRSSTEQIGCMGGMLFYS